MFLQSLVFGYGGVRFTDAGLSMDPLLPPGVTAMKLRGLNVAGSELDVEVDGEGAKFSRRRSGEEEVEELGPLAVTRAHDGVYWLARQDGVQ